jgi:hypothetical protein
MSLQARLDQIKAAGQARIPEAVRAVMERATADLVASGLTARAVTVGDRMPAFALPAVSGRRVVSDELLARGPLVVSFYRGRW